MFDDNSRLNLVFVVVVVVVLFTLGFFLFTCTALVLFYRNTLKVEAQVERQQAAGEAGTKQQQQKRRALFG